jgi:hypothetical protein
MVGLLITVASSGAASSSALLGLPQRPSSSQFQSNLAQGCSILRSNSTPLSRRPPPTGLRASARGGRVRRESRTRRRVLIRAGEAPETLVPTCPRPSEGQTSRLANTLALSSRNVARQDKAQVHGAPLVFGRGVAAARWLRCWGKTQGPALRCWVERAFLPPRGEEKFQTEK